VLGDIPVYAKQTTILLTTICEAIDKKIRRFVWGSTPEHKKIHMVSWERVCTPKVNGGLGLRRAKDLNFTYLIKLTFSNLQNSSRF
ncbi:Putative ribonuclease H protein At1g65750, partial [Linum perenne]